MLIGVDIGGTNMQVGVVDGAGQVIERAALKTDARAGFEAVVASVVEAIEGLGNDVTPSSVGVACAGAIDAASGVILDAPNLGWTDAPLRDALHERLGVRVVVENDVNAAVWGEYHLGAGREAMEDGHDALGVWVGTGVGGGLIIDGKLHRGDMDTAGEIGQTILKIDAPKGRRTVEDWCSRTGLRRQIAGALVAHPDSVLAGHGDVRNIGTDEIAAAFASGDPLGTGVVNRSAKRLGVAIANWVTVLAPRLVILGGGMVEALGEPYVDRIRESFEESVFPKRSRACDFVTTELKADAGLLGAALLARP